MEVQNGDILTKFRIWEIIEGIEEAPSSCVNANMKKVYENNF
jgi:hypothetical protein